MWSVVIACVISRLVHANGIPTGIPGFCPMGSGNGVEIVPCPILSNFNVI